jgi:hypothetical protein
MCEPDALRLALYQNRTTSTSTSLTSYKSSTRSGSRSSSMSRRKSGRCPEPIRPLTISVVVPESVERVILSIEIDVECRDTNGKRGATRNLLAAFAKRSESRESSRVRLANFREV